MIQEIRIQGHPLDTPSNLSINLKEESPLASTQLTIGDYTQGFKLPNTPPNQKVFGFVHRTELKDKVVKYDDVEIIDSFLGRIRGHLLIQGAVTSFGGGTIDTDFFTNLLGFDIFNEKLADCIADNKTGLGSSTAAILAAAKAQNDAPLSTNGTTGAKMKFVPHQNTDFYDADINPAWLAKPRPYDGTKTYEKDDAVTFQRPTAIDEPERYIAKTSISTGETPHEFPSKWERVPNAVLNDWDSAGSGFFKNATTKIGNKYYQNFHALVPWPQLHEIVRLAAVGFGYKAQGEYLSDAHESRALICSNYALSRVSQYRLLLQLNDPNDLNVLALPPGALHEMDSVVQEPIDENDAEGLFDEPTQIITVTRKGTYILKTTGFVWIDEDGVTPTHLYITITDDNDVILVNEHHEFPVGSFPDGNTTQEFEIEVHYEYDYAGEDGSQSQGLKLKAEVQFDDGNGGVLTNTFMEFSNVIYQGVDEYSGDYKPSNSVPDITVADFLEAIRTTFNLLLEFDGAARVLRMNYAESVLAGKFGVEDADPYKVDSEKVKFKPKKRFALDWGVPSSNTETEFDGYTISEPIDTIAELEGYILGNNVAPTTKKAILVRALNAWLLTAPSKHQDRNVWVLHSWNYPELRIEAEGDLMSIKPMIGPVDMGYFKNAAGNLLIAPIMHGEGRGGAGASKGERAPFQICYWVGYDTSTVENGYPYATPTKTNGAGTNILPRGMQWGDLYPQFWKRTLQSIVNEEIITRSFIIPPIEAQNITWEKLLLLNNVQTLILSRMRKIGTSQRQQMELRKIQRPELVVVSDVGDSDEPTPGPDPTYLFNLIPAPLLTLGMSKKVEGYEGDVAQIENNADGVFELPFNENGYADMAAADAFFTEDADPNLYYDQFGDNDFNDDSAGTQYSKLDNDFMTGLMRRTHSITPFTGSLASLKNNDPYSIVIVVDSKDIPTTGNTIYPLKFPGSAGSLRVVWSGNGTTLIVRYEGPNQGWQFSGLRSAGTKLIIITSDGGAPLHRDGLKLYWNGNTTPEVASHSYNSGNPAEQTITGVEAGAWGGDSWFKEFDLLPYVATTQHITTIKEFYEGKGYPFS
jgi:hypothetical protein